MFDPENSQEKIIRHICKMLIQNLVHHNLIQSVFFLLSDKNN